MSTLLHVDSSPLYGRSVSRELTGAFVAQWKLSHPNGAVIERDLNATAIAPINAEFVGAMYTPDEARTPQQKEVLSLSDILLAELEQAEEYVFGVPMHNFGVPSVLKLWIDQIARKGRTFEYGEGKPKGLIIGKKATFIIATGGMYDAQTQMASFNFVEPYPVCLRLPRSDGCDVPHSRRDHGTKFWTGPRRVSGTAPTGRANARTQHPLRDWKSR